MWRPGNRARDEKPSYVMVKAGAWGKGAVQLHRFFGWDRVTVSEEVPFKVIAGDCEVSEDHSFGHICVTSEDVEAHPEWMCGAGEMLLVNYESPDGAKRHNRLWNGGNGHGTVELYRKHPTGDELIDQVEAFNVGCEYGEYDR